MFDFSHYALQSCLFALRFFRAARIALCSAAFSRSTDSSRCAMQCCFLALCYAALLHCNVLCCTSFALSLYFALHSAVALLTLHFIALSCSECSASDLRSFHLAMSMLLVFLSISTLTLPIFPPSLSISLNQRSQKKRCQKVATPAQTSQPSVSQISAKQPFFGTKLPANQFTTQSYGKINAPQLIAKSSHQRVWTKLLKRRVGWCWIRISPQLK
jgi:hypothetical protein